MPADTVEVVVKLTGLGAVQAGMRQFRAAINGPLEAAATRIRGFALGLGSTFLAGLSVYRIGAELGKALTEMDRADEVSQKLGIAADELTALNFAATLADSSAEKLQNGLKFLARSVDEGAESFTTLGIQLRNAAGAFRPQREILEDIADRFAAMPDGIEKTALALKLFGKEGVSMIPLLFAGGIDGVERDPVGGVLLFGSNTNTLIGADDCGKFEAKTGPGPSKGRRRMTAWRRGAIGLLERGNIAHQSVLSYPRRRIPR